VEIGDPPPDDSGGDSATRRFDFGQFRHDMGADGAGATLPVRRTGL
jgi:hypothetical protein